MQETIQIEIETGKDTIPALNQIQELSNQGWDVGTPIAFTLGERAKVVIVLTRVQQQHAP